MDYQSLNFNGADILYSPGGGMGLEGGIQLKITKNFYTSISVGYQRHLAFQSENVYGVSNKTSFNFNRKFLKIR